MRREALSESLSPDESFADVCSWATPSGQQRYCWSADGASSPFHCRGAAQKALARSSRRATLTQQAAASRRSGGVCIEGHLPQSSYESAALDAARGLQWRLGERTRLSFHLHACRVNVDALLPSR